MSLRMCALTLCNTTAHLVHVIVTRGEQVLARLPPHGTLRLPWSAPPVDDDALPYAVVAVIGGVTTRQLLVSDRKAVITVRAAEPGALAAGFVLELA